MANRRKIPTTGAGAEEPKDDSGGFTLEAGSATPDIETIDPASVSSDATGGDTDSSSGEPRRGRGRPKGSKNGVRKADQQKANPENLTKLLVSLHLMGSVLLKTPELAIDQEEGKQLSNAIQEVNEQYNFIINEKVAAWGNLGIAFATVYGPRIIAITANSKKAKNPNVQKSPVIISPQVGLAN